MATEIKEVQFALANCAVCPYILGNNIACSKITAEMIATVCQLSGEGSSGLYCSQHNYNESLRAL